MLFHLGIPKGIAGCILAELLLLHCRFDLAVLRSLKRLAKIAELGPRVTYHLQMFWTVNLTMKHLHTLLPAIRRSPAYMELLGDLRWAPMTLQKAYSLVLSDGIFAFWHRDGTEDLGIVSQLLRMVVVVSYFNYYLFYIQIGVCCDWVSNAMESQRFCTR